MIYKAETYQIIGACIEVHREKGCGFLEPVYHECLEIELDLQKIPAISKPKLELEYKGRKLNKAYEPDFVCRQDILLEIKAVAKLTDEHRAQIINYLNATSFPLGLLVNFGASGRLEWERFANTKDTSTSKDARATVEPPTLQS